MGARRAREAEAVVQAEPSLTNFLLTSILNHASLEDAVIQPGAARLAHPALSATLIEQTYREAVRRQPEIGHSFRCDILGGRGPRSGLHPADRADALLQGFPTPSRPIGWRIGCWNEGPHRFRALLAEASPRRCSRRNIHPASRMGRGLFLDHRHGPRRRHDRRCRGRRLAAPGSDAPRHRQGGRRTPPEDPPRGSGGRRREDPGQYRGGACARASRRAPSCSKESRRRPPSRAGRPGWVGEAGCAEPARNHGPDPGREPAPGLEPGRERGILSFRAGMACMASHEIFERKKKGVSGDQVRTDESGGLSAPHLLEPFHQASARAPRRYDYRRGLTSATSSSAVLFLDDEDERNRSYQFQMAIPRDRHRAPSELGRIDRKRRALRRAPVFCVGPWAYGPGARGARAAGSLAATPSV